MQPVMQQPPGSQYPDALCDIPAHLQPAAFTDTQPQLAALVSALLHRLSSTLTPTSHSSHLSTLHSQQLSRHYSLSLLLHHTQHALAAHPHRFPRLTAALHTADLSFCLRSQGVDGGVAGVIAEDVWDVCGADAMDGYELREERRRLVELVEQRMGAQLETMRAAYDDDVVDSNDQADRQRRKDGDKENTPYNSHDDVAEEPASYHVKATSLPTSTRLAASRPVSAAFVTLTSPPTPSTSTSTTALPIASLPSSATRTAIDSLLHRRQLLERQHVALQLHLLSLHAQLLSDHRLSAIHDNDTALLSCLQAKAHCLALKLQLMTAHADLLEPTSAPHSDSSRDSQADNVWADVLGRLETRRAEVAGGVQRMQDTKSGYEAAMSGVHGDEWQDVSARWRDVQRRRREKQWALNQLSG